MQTRLWELTSASTACGQTREREKESERKSERERERECAIERQGFMTRSTETINIARRDKGCPFVPNINHLSTGCNDKKHENITMSKNDLLQVRRRDNLTIQKQSLTELCPLRSAVCVIASRDLA